jgi:hypothetical protein
MYPPSIDMKQTPRDVYEEIASPSTNNIGMANVKGQQEYRMAKSSFSSLEHIAQHIDDLETLTQKHQHIV